MNAITWVFFSLVCPGLACENIRFSSLFAAGDVSRGGETSTAAKSEEKRMFSQASPGWNF